MVEYIIESKSRYRTRLGMRGVFSAPPGYNVVVSDYSS